jgi:hypothetical protein
VNITILVHISVDEPLINVLISCTDYLKSNIKQIIEYCNEEYMRRYEKVERPAQCKTCGDF